jgi:hypothetical protein
LSLVIVTPSLVAATLAFGSAFSRIAMALTASPPTTQSRCAQAGEIAVCVGRAITRGTRLRGRGALAALAVTSKELGTGVLQRGGESPTRT